MEFKVRVDQLKKAVSIVKRGLPKIVLQEERGHLLCRIEENKLVLYATNNDIKTYSKINLIETDTSDLSFTLDPKIIEKLLTKIDVNEICVTYDEEEKTIRIYTTLDRQSFTTLQSFPVEKMLTFSPPEEDGDSIVINREVACAALEFCSNFLAPLKENRKQYDFIIINKGIVYGANGLNRMGFFVSTEFQHFINFKIRKESVPDILGALKSLCTDEVMFINNDKDSGIRASSEDEDTADETYFTCLKSGTEPPKINTEFIKGDNAYSLINKTKLTKSLDRLSASASASTGAGIEIKLSGKNEDGVVTLNLISNLKTREQVECVRVNDQENMEIEHVLDYKLFKTILASFNDNDLKVYINDTGKFFKIASTGKIKNIKYLTAGIGAYSKVVK